jgi:hypothetical protein
MKLISFILIILFLIPLYIYAQEPGKPSVKFFILSDNSTISIENPKGVPLSEGDIEQVIKASKNIKKQDEHINKGLSIDSENYKKQLETDLEIEKMKLKVAKEGYRREIQKERYELGKQKEQQKIERGKAKLQ